MINNKVNSNFMLLILVMATVLAAIILEPSLIIVEIFAIFYVLVIYKFFNSSNRKMLYYFAFLFSIVALGNRYHYYFVFILYCIYLIKDLEIKKINVREMIQNKYTVFLLIFILYMIISVFWSKDKIRSIGELVRYAISISMLLIFIYENRNKENLKETLRFFRFLFIGILILGIMEIFRVNLNLGNHLLEKGITHIYAQRIPVTFFNNPNNYAVFIVMGIILNIDVLIKNVKSKEYYISTLSFVLAIINIIFTRSRTAFITGFLTIIFIFIISLINWKQHEFRDDLLKFCVKFFALGFFIYFILAINPSMNYYTDKFGNIPFVKQIESFLYSAGISTGEEVVIPPVIGEAGSDNVRFTIIYDITKNATVDGQYFGEGVGNTYTFLKDVGNTNGTYAAHSYWFELLCDFGIGIFLYVILIYGYTGIKMVFSKKSRKRRLDEQYVIGVALLFSWVILAFGPSSIVSYPPFWISMGIIYSIYKMNFIV